MLPCPPDSLQAAGSRPSPSNTFKTDPETYPQPLVLYLEVRPLVLLTVYNHLPLA